MSERARRALGVLWRLAVYVVVFVAGTALVGELVSLALGRGVFGGEGADPLADPLGAMSPAALVAVWLPLGGALVAHVVMVRLVDRRPWADVALGRRAARPWPLGAGAAFGAAAVGVPALALLAAGWLGVDATPGGGAAAWLRAAGAMLAFMAPAALFEELAFRGYPFLVLREAAGPAVALALTSVVFGLVHAQNPGATPGALAVVTLAGVFLGAVLLVTDSLWAAWTAHLAWNWTLGAVLHAAVSGLPVATPNYRVVDAGPDWATGGAWGPEGGAAAAAGLAGATTLLLARRRRSAPSHDDPTLFARPAGRGSS